MVSDNFLSTVFLAIHVSLSGIVTYLRMIPDEFFRILMYWAITLDVINELSGGGLQGHPALGMFLGGSPPELHQHIENLVAALTEIEEGLPRHAMYETVMRIIGVLAFSA